MVVETEDNMSVMKMSIIEKVIKRMRNIGELYQLPHR